ncbi:F-box protein 15, variant 2 [Balamuthia mandrillaris]
MGWELLPTEVVLKILCFVDINSLLTLRRVSKRFGYELTKDPFLWKQRCKLEFGVEPTQVCYRFYWIPLHHSKLLDDLFQKGWEWLYWSKRFDVHAQVLATKSCYGTPSKLMKEGVGYFTWCGKQFNSYYYEGQWALASSSSSENELLGRSRKKKKTSAGWLVATTGSEDLRRKGVGICRWTNGNVYVGQWHNDRMNGKGSFSFLSLSPLLQRKLMKKLSTL